MARWATPIAKVDKVVRRTLEWYTLWLLAQLR